MPFLRRHDRRIRLSRHHPDLCRIAEILSPYMMPTHSARLSAGAFSTLSGAENFAKVVEFYDRT